MPVPEPRWPWLDTVLRVLFTAVMIWAFHSGSSALSFGLLALLAMVTVPALLLAYEFAIRDLPQGWVAAGVFVPITVSLAAYGAWLATRPPVPTGPLLPAREPTPQASCVEKVGPKDLVMAIGTDRVVGTGPGPFYPLMVGDCTIMTLRQVGRGLSQQVITEVLDLLSRFESLEASGVRHLCRLIGAGAPRAPMQ